MNAWADGVVDVADGAEDGAVDGADVGVGRGLWSQLVKPRRRAAANDKRNSRRWAIFSRSP